MKLLSDLEEKGHLRQVRNKPPTMVGPDKCSTDHKLLFISNSKTQQWQLQRATLDDVRRHL